MSRLARRAVLMPEGPSGIPTYAEFVASETARSGSTNLPPSNTLGFSTGLYRTTLDASSDGGSGSPWMRTAGFGGRAITFARHAMPSQAVFDAYRAAGRMVSYNVVTVGTNSVTGLNRNGFMTGDDTTDTGTCSDFRYYDDVLGPLKMNPLAGTGPTPYALGT